MPMSSDMFFPPADCQAEWRLIPDAEFRPIQTIDGHLALFGADPNALSQLDKHLGELLASKSLAAQPGVDLLAWKATAEDAMETVGLGFCFEDLPVGRQFKTIGRTVTEADITNFVNCTGMVEVLFTNLEFLAA